MNRFFLFFISLILMFFSGCQNDKKNTLFTQWMKSEGKIRTLSTTQMVGDLVQTVGGEYVTNMTLIIGELDPHSYQLVKGDDEKLASADLIFFNGLGLEHGPSLQRHLIDNPKAIPLGDMVRKKDPALILNFQGQIDPHIWMDISLWAKTIPYIVEALSIKDPAHQDDYRANGEKLKQEMAQAHQRIRDMLQQIPEEKRYLVTSHDAFNYFARAYLASNEEQTKGNWMQRFAAPEGLAPDSQLSASDIQFIIDHLKRYNIKILFPEANVSKDSIKKILTAGSENGLQLKISSKSLYGDSMGAPSSDGGTYIKMIEHNAKTILDEL